MQTLYVKSAGFNVNPTQQSVFKQDNKGYVLTRGINILIINNNNDISHINYDTYAHNLEQNIIDTLKNAYNNIYANTIIMAVHDDCTGGISVGRLQQNIPFMNVNVLKHVKFRNSYLLVFDNISKKTIDEFLSPNNIIEKTYAYDINKHRIITAKNKYLCCTKWMYKYFVEYVDSFINTFGLKLLLADDINTVNFESNPGITYIFCQSIPQKAYNCSANKILLNTEQASNAERKEPCLSAINKNIPVIDYAPENIQIFNNPLVHFLPYQYTNEIHKLYTFLNVPKVYDVAFCGTIGNSLKRKNILDQLAVKGIKVHIIDGWGDIRDKEIGKCKILLNIHYHDTYNIYESLRVDRWVMAGMLVVSETSLNNTILDISNLVLFESYNNLVSKVIDVIKYYDIYQYDFLKKHAVSINKIKNDRNTQMMMTKNKLGL